MKQNKSTYSKGSFKDVKKTNKNDVKSKNMYEALEEFETEIEKPEIIDSDTISVKSDDSILTEAVKTSLTNHAQQRYKEREIIPYNVKKAIKEESKKNQLQQGSVTKSRWNDHVVVYAPQRGKNKIITSYTVRCTGEWLGKDSNGSQVNLIINCADNHTVFLWGYIGADLFVGYGKNVEMITLVNMITGETSEEFFENVKENGVTNVHLLNKKFDLYKVQGRQREERFQISLKTLMDLPKFQNQGNLTGFWEGVSDSNQSIMLTHQCKDTVVFLTVWKPYDKKLYHVIKEAGEINALTDWNDYWVEYGVSRVSNGIFKTFSCRTPLDLKGSDDLVRHRINKGTESKVSFAFIRYFELVDNTIKHTISDLAFTKINGNMILEENGSVHFQCDFDELNSKRDFKKEELCNRIKSMILNDIDPTDLLKDNQELLTIETNYSGKIRNPSNVAESWSILQKSIWFGKYEIIKKLIDTYKPDLNRKLGKWKETLLESFISKEKLENDGNRTDFYHTERDERIDMLFYLLANDNVKKEVTEEMKKVIKKVFQLDSKQEEKMNQLLTK